MSESRLVSLEFGRLYVREEGTGETPLVLLHGLLVTHHTFRHVIPGLSEDRRVVAFDLPGCGESDRPPPAEADGYSLAWLADCVVEALDVLGLRRVDLLGHSLGAAVAIHVATRHPRRVRRLVIVDGLCFPVQLDLLGGASLLPVVGSFLFQHVLGRRDLERHLRKSLAAPETLEPLAVDIYWDRLARDGGRAAALAMLYDVERLERMHDRLPQVVQPALVVWGDRDAIVPRTHADDLVAAIPDATLEVVEGCGHTPAEERPDELVRLLRPFLGH